MYRDAWPAALSGRLGGSSLRVWEERVELAKPLGTAERLRFAFASDFHAGPLTPRASIEATCRSLASASADLVLLGGDFVSIAPRHASRLLSPLRSVRAPLGVFAVLGNHDHWAGAAAVADMLADAGVTLLTNRSHRLPAPFENTMIVGLDDHTSGLPDPLAPRWEAERTTILLLHQPSGILDAAGRPFDLALAGHTHGGQILLPGGYAPVVPQGVLTRRYLAGRYTLESGGHLLVSVGVGNSGLPIRIGPAPEILVCEMVGGASVPNPKESGPCGPTS